MMVIRIYCCRYRFADVAELADALDLGSSTARCGGSIPFIRTIFLIVDRLVYYRDYCYNIMYADVAQW